MRVLGSKCELVRTKLLNKWLLSDCNRTTVLESWSASGAPNSALLDGWPCPLYHLASSYIIHKGCVKAFPLTLDSKREKDNWKWLGPLARVLVADSFCHVFSGIECLASISKVLGTIPNWISVDFLSFSQKRTSQNDILSSLVCVTVFSRYGSTKETLSSWAWETTRTPRRMWSCDTIQMKREIWRLTENFPRQVMWCLYLSEVKG